MRTKIKRPISVEEAEVIRITLAHAATTPDLRGLGVNASLLQVVGKCDCGCDSVDFEGYGEVPNAKPLADGIGITRRGGKVGVIVWGTSKLITSLEIYDLGVGEKDIKLPMTESIQSFEKSKV
jgi:hypothetical protein